MFYRLSFEEGRDLILRRLLKPALRCPVKWMRMDNRTEPKTLGQWIRYIVVAVIALWLVVWMLRISGINIL
jgi:hypothetical protein